MLPYFPLALRPENLTCRSSDDLNHLLYHVKAMIKRKILDKPTGQEYVQTILQSIQNLQQYLGQTSSSPAHQDRRTPGIKNERPAQVVLVEKRTTPRPDVAAGFIIPLQVIIDPLSDHAEQDIISFNNAGLSDNDMLFMQITLAFRFAKTYILGKHVARMTFFRVVYQFPNLDAAVTGGSLGLAACLQTIVVLSRICGHRFSYAIRPDVTFTGSLDGHGTITAVSPDSVVAKLRAAWFSPIRVLVLPQENHGNCITLLNELTQTYPGKRLVLKTPATVADCLQDPAIVRRYKRPIADRLNTRRFRRQILFSLLSALTVLSMTLVAILALDDNPVELIGNGRTIVARNAKGRALWSQSFPETQPLQPGWNRRTRYVIQDFNGDDNNEVLYAPFLNRDAITPHLILYSHNGDILWQYQEVESPVFGHQVYDPLYRTTLILPYQFKNTTFLFAVLQHEPYFPCKLIQFDLEGTPVQTAWNPGALYCARLIDEDGDDIPELFLTGTHNDFDQGIILIFDIDNIDGATPATDQNYYAHGAGPSRAKYIIRLPRINPLFQSQDREMVLLVNRDASGHYFLNFNTCYGGILIRLDQDFQLLDIDFTDEFIDNYYNANQQVFSPSRYYEPILRALHHIEFWDGFRWVNRKTVNYYYSH